MPKTYKEQFGVEFDSPEEHAKIRARRNPEAIAKENAASEEFSRQRSISRAKTQFRRSEAASIGADGYTPSTSSTTDTKKLKIDGM